MSRPSALFDQVAFSGNSRFERINLRTTSLGSLQWIQHAGPGTAVITIWASDRPSDHEDLTTPPPGNITWSLTPILFGANPSGVPASEILPFAENGVATLGVLIEATGNLTLSLLAFLSEAQG